MSSYNEKCAACERLKSGKCLGQCDFDRIYCQKHNDEVLCNDGECVRRSKGWGRI